MFQKIHDGSPLVMLGARRGKRNVADRFWNRSLRLPSRNQRDFALTDSKPSEERSMYRHLAVLCGPLDSLEALDFTSTQLAWRLGRMSKIAAGPFAVWRNALRLR